MRLWRQLLLGLMLTWSVMEAETECDVRYKNECGSTKSFFTTGMTFLVYESHSSEQTVRCASRRWFHLHADGQQEVLDASNIMSTKHTIMEDTLYLNLRNVSVVDEGAYGCDAAEGFPNSTEVCLYVQNRAVFASCPTELDGCASVVQINMSSTARSVSLDASVTYRPDDDSSCNGPQNFSSIYLRSFTSAYSFPFECKPSNCANSVDNVMLSRGESGHDFVFMLTNVNASETYDVELEGMHPNGMHMVTITKRFSVNIVPDSVTDISLSTSIIPATTHPLAVSTDDHGATTIQATAANPTTHPTVIISSSADGISLSTNDISPSSNSISSSTNEISSSTSGTSLSPTDSISSLADVTSSSTKILSVYPTNSVNTSSSSSTNSPGTTTIAAMSIPDDTGKYKLIVGVIAGVLSLVLVFLVAIVIITCWRRKAGWLKSHGDTSESSSSSSRDHNCCHAEFEIIEPPRSIHPLTIVESVQPSPVTIMPAPGFNAETASHNSDVYLPEHINSTHVSV